MNRYLMPLSLMLVTLGACDSTARQESATSDSAVQAPAAPAMDAEVQRAVAVYRGIEAAPAAADSVLEAHGLTPAGLDSLMYGIASDSVRAAVYRDAIRQVPG